jgi:hypothetical protein
MRERPAGTRLDKAELTMRTLAPLALLSFTSFALVVAGCSGSDSSDPFGAEPDYASVQQRIASPTGTIGERNLSSLFSKYSEQNDTSSMANVGLGKSTGAAPATGSGTSSTRSQAIHILGGGSGLTASCSALAQGQLTGSCGCPSGGSFTYDFNGLRSVQQSAGPIDASLKVRFDGCHMNDVGLDGREFVHFHANRGGSSVDLSSLDLVLVADLTVSKGAETHTIDLAAILRQGQLEIAVAVDDGWVTIRATSSGAPGSGSFVVRDRNSTWTCDVNNGSGTCHDGAGNTRTF